jgi:hypothetical protein
LLRIRRARPPPDSASAFLANPRVNFSSMLLELQGEIVGPGTHFAYRSYPVDAQAAHVEFDTAAILFRTAVESCGPMSASGGTTADQQAAQHCHGRAREYATRMRTAAGRNRGEFTRKYGDGCIREKTALADRRLAQLDCYAGGSAARTAAECFTFPEPRPAAEEQRGVRFEPATRSPCFLMPVAPVRPLRPASDGCPTQPAL